MTSCTCSAPLGTMLGCRPYQPITPMGKTCMRASLYHPFTPCTQTSAPATIPPTMDRLPDLQVLLQLKPRDIAGGAMLNAGDCVQFLVNLYMSQTPSCAALNPCCRNVNAVEVNRYKCRYYTLVSEFTWVCVLIFPSQKTLVVTRVESSKDVDGLHRRTILANNGLEDGRQVVIMPILSSADDHTDRRKPVPMNSIPISIWYCVSQYKRSCTDLHVGSLLAGNADMVVRRISEAMQALEYLSARFPYNV